MERMQAQRLQSFAEALKAKTDIPVKESSTMQRPVGSGQAGSARDELARVQADRRALEQLMSADPSAAFKARMQELRDAAGAALGGVPSSGDASAIARASENIAGRNSMGQFANAQPGTDRFHLGASLEAPKSRYSITAGASVIPAVLISGINSDLPGSIRAQVSQNVYDTATGRHLLIPQGTQLAGEYSNQVLYGQKGVLIAMQRMIFPDGRTLDIGSMPAADSAGYSGLRDQVDNHYFRIYSSALLMSGIVAGVALSQDRGGRDAAGQQRASDAMSEALGQQLGQATSQQISKNLNIAPTLQIRPGYRFNIIVTKDLVFDRAFKPFQYQQGKP